MTQTIQPPWLPPFLILTYEYDLRNSEKYHINFAHTENYRKSAVPFCQRLLNQDHRKQEERTRHQGEEQRARARRQERGGREQEREESRARREGL